MIFNWVFLRRKKVKKNARPGKLLWEVCENFSPNLYDNYKLLVYITKYVCIQYVSKVKTKQNRTTLKLLWSLILAFPLFFNILIACCLTIQEIETRLFLWYKTLLALWRFGNRSYHFQTDNSLKQNRIHLNHKFYRRMSKIYWLVFLTCCSWTTLWKGCFKVETKQNNTKAESNLSFSFNLAA